MKKIISIAIDAMGGDNAPKKNIEGLDLFLNKNKNNDDFVIKLYGDEKILNEEISKKKLKVIKLRLFTQMELFRTKKLH